MDKAAYPNSVHTGNVAMRTRLRSFKLAIRQIEAGKFAEEIELRDFADYAFLAHVIAAQELADRKSAPEIIVFHAGKAIDFAWCAPLSSIEIDFCKLMLRSALTRGQAGGLAGADFYAELPQNVKIRKVRHWIRSILDLQRRSKTDRPAQGDAPVYSGIASYSIGHFSVQFNKKRSEE